MRRVDGARPLKAAANEERVENGLLVERSDLPNGPTLSDSEEEDDGASSGSSSGCIADDARAPLLDFDTICQEERSHIQNCRAAREEADGGGVPFSVAFSGGGMRAAAFQAGVLWRLAEENRLKDVEFLAAVSGGGYIAASYASHLHDAINDPSIGAPRRKEEVKDWYLGVVARALVRMQRNAGNFVRDCCADPCGWPRDGSGWLPRIFDLPILLCTLGYTICIGPLATLVVMWVPVAEGINLFFGSAMRAGFCTPAAQPLRYQTISESVAISFDELSTWTEFQQLRKLILVSAIVTFVVWLSRVLPPCWHRPVEETRGRRQYRRAQCLVLVDGIKAFLIRFTVVLLVLLMLIMAVVAVEMYIYSSSCVETRERLEWCLDYILTNGTLAIGPGSMMRCNELHNGLPWYVDPVFEANFFGKVNCTLANSTPQQRRHFVHDYMSCHSGAQASDLEDAVETTIDKYADEVLPTITGATLLVFVAAVCLSPFIKHGAWLCISVVGPFFVFCFMLVFVQFRVYAPLTDQKLFATFRMSYTTWYACVIVSMVFTFILTFGSHEVRSVFHNFYKATLKKNFLAGGRDVSLREVQNNAWCPFLVFTGTLNDYKGPGATRTINEIFFSSLYTGSHTTGYAATRPWFTLGRSTALTAAGCLDAISLGMADHLRSRFWLDVLNLSWGDYLLFDSAELPRHCKFYQRWADRKGADVRSCLYGRRMTQFLHRLPSTLLFLAIATTLSLGMHQLANVPVRDFGPGNGTLPAGPDDPAGCDEARSYFRMAALATVLLFLFSFLTSACPCLDLLVYNPLVRQCHQATQYYYRGNRPPSLVYVTDGGIQDCTCILQLLRRRCRGILLVLANGDPDDELKVFTAAIELAKQEQLASFFDPDEPRRDVQLLLEKFRKTRTLKKLELGIRYGWSYDTENGTESVGHLVVVKNRLPEGREGRLCQPLLTEQEICRKGRFAALGEEQDSIDEDGDGSGMEGCGVDVDLSDMQETELGGLGCCSWCHRAGCNCGRKFPHLEGTGYLWLTPGIFNALCRLGHDVSKDGVDALVSRLQQ